MIFRPIFQLAALFWMSACFSQAPEIAESDFFCDCECDPVPVVVMDAQTHMKIELAQVSVKRWEADQWAPVASCGVSGLDAAAESVTDDESSISDQGAAPCFFTATAGLYAFTVMAPGYASFEERIRLGDEQNSLDVCDCNCSGFSAQEFLLEPLD
ncbi:MAG: hypothetical protein CMH56_16970 [Myxococcales bacterium]|nr:hypothetical protein [Myxococcales bacterium]